jgi:hypothetical protein
MTSASDLIEVKPSMVDVLKRLLGQDSFTVEIKYESSFSQTFPKAQLMVVSNHPSEFFDGIRSEPAFLEKIIPLQMSPDLIIPSQFRRADLTPLFEICSSDFRNWCLYAPRYMLGHFIRGTDFRQRFFENNPSHNSQKGLKTWLEDCCSYGGPDDQQMPSFVDAKEALF